MSERLARILPRLGKGAGQFTVMTLGSGSPVLTHYIPRYNLPLFGVFAIGLCLAATFLLVLVAGTWARRPQPAFDEPWKAALRATEVLVLTSDKSTFDER
jgi:hypothetical protein